MDACIRWGSLAVANDGVELGRQGKADLVARYAAETRRFFTLRVCYSEVNKDLNCGRCEKCYRTIMNLVLANQDPRAFGIPFSLDTYSNLFRALARAHSSTAFRLIWKEISDRARQALDTGRFFVVSDRLAETGYIRRIADGEIDQALARNQGGFGDRMERWRYVLRHRSPFAYSVLRQLRSVVFGKPIPAQPRID
jgi:hypothetical protein